MAQLMERQATADELTSEDAAVDPPKLGADLTACDQEPIHIPGAIQPHGLLLVVEAANQRIVAGAGDIEVRLATAWLGENLADVLGLRADTALGAAGSEEPVVLGPIRGRTEQFDVVARYQDGHWLVQLEPQAQLWSDAASLLGWLDRAGGTFERASDLQSLCDRAAVAFRELTGFARVMIYRFLDNEAGAVVAESRDPSLGSFLNHHFPASDIPKQARALYVRNRVRVIPNVTYTPQPLRPAAYRQLDLSDVDLRSVSPIHLQYLKNMGVEASASTSIVKDGLLWGLVACHNQQPRGLGFGQRLACQTLAGSLARQIRAKEEAEDYRERLRLRSREDVVAGKLMADTPLKQVLTSSSEELQRMLAADGFAIIQGPALHTMGHHPGEIEIRDLASWVRQTATTSVLHTSALGSRFPAAQAYRDRCSGLLASVVSDEEPIILMWFRAEQVEVINWAGNPHKAVETSGETLTPRTSFAAWSEEVHGQAHPWSLPEVEATQRLTRTIHDILQTRRIRDLNRTLTVTLADKESLLVQKDYLIKEVNHRVQNSLQLVSAFLALQARAEGSEALSASLAEAQRRLGAVALVHRRLYSDDNVETIDLERYLTELVAEMKTSMGPEWAEQIKTDFAPVLVPTDAAVNVGLILTELVINANKYAYGGKAGPIELSLEQHRNSYRLIVADQGQGKTGERKGFGTRMLNAMVDRLGGTLAEVSNKPGLRVIFTAPVRLST